jgi:hypothetical protein
MSDEKKEYSNEMRGTLWAEPERTNDKAPVASGTVTISGLELRIAMWPARVASQASKAAGKKYWPIAVEYKQGTQFVLAKVSPVDIVVPAANGAAAGGVPGVAPAAQGDVGDLPF